MNAQKIWAWRDANPTTLITEAILLDILGLKTLWDANLRSANLQYANLQGADLQGANIQDADLRDADLQGAVLSVMRVSGMPSGDLLAFPCPDGWWIRVGCWEGTPDDLRELVAADDGWPEAEGAEIARRRPYLEAALSLIDLHVAAHPGVVESLAQKWGQS